MRSKTLLLTNIFTFLYCDVVLWLLIGIAIIDSGGKNIIKTIGGFFEKIFELVNLNLHITNYLYVLAILLLVHIGLFVVGLIIAWIAYILKKDGVGIAAAIIYLIGTISSPISMIFGIPVTVCTFIGAYNQRKLNKAKK